MSVNTVVLWKDEKKLIKTGFFKSEVQLVSCVGLMVWYALTQLNLFLNTLEQKKHPYWNFHTHDATVLTCKNANSENCVASFHVLYLFKDRIYHVCSFSRLIFLPHIDNSPFRLSALFFILYVFLSLPPILVVQRLLFS